jgi:hypothetical protein
MSTSDLRRNVPQHADLHPRVYGMLAGSVLWMVLAAWLAFGSDGYTALQLVVVVGFALAFLLTPFCLSRLAPARAARDATPFRDWLDHDFETNTGTVRTRDAAVMILVAPLAGAIGLTAIGLVAWLAAAGAL